MKKDFKIFYNTLITTISSYNFFVDFEKVKKNRDRFIIELNILNSLIGRCNADFFKLFMKILDKYPNVIKVFPILLATRENCIELIDNL